MHLYTFISRQNDDDHVDGVRLRLWSAATDGSIVYPLDYMNVENHGGMILTGKNPDSSIRALRQSYQQSSVSKSGGTLAFEVIFTCCKIL
jgi:hypothetical protein